MACAAVGSAGCGSFRTMIAPSGDLEDYRAFRVAAAPGTRLARAQRYLARHPSGSFAAEVRAAFDDEEPRYFERAQTSREGARDYLVDLPDGPHAAAAMALLVAFGSSMRDAELRDIARRARYDDAKLESAAVQRRAVGEAVLSALGVFLDDDTYGRTRAEASPALAERMQGSRRAPTWGGMPAKREEDLFFLLPTRPERESRLLTLELELLEVDGRITGATIAGADLFVMWAEADQITRLDPSATEDRNEAQVHALDRLGGALERRFPAASCAVPSDRQLIRRACHGWSVVVTAGTSAGARDSIVIRKEGGGAGPDAKKQGER